MMTKNEKKNVVLDYIILAVSLVLLVLFFCPLIKITENIPMLGEVTTETSLIEMFGRNINTMYRALSILYFIFLLYIFINSIVMWCAPVLKKVLL